jgi:hypothetical protein
MRATFSIAIAIGLSKARKKGKKVPRKKVVMKSAITRYSPR